MIYKFFYFLSFILHLCRSSQAVKGAGLKKFIEQNNFVLEKSSLLVSSQVRMKPENPASCIMLSLSHALKKIYVIRKLLIK